MDLESRDFQARSNEGADRRLAVDRRQTRLQQMRIVTPVSHNPFDIFAFKGHARPIGIPLRKLARFRRCVERGWSASGGAKRQQHDEYDLEWIHGLRSPLIMF